MVHSLDSHPYLAPSGWFSAAGPTRGTADLQIHMAVTAKGDEAEPRGPSTYVATPRSSPNRRSAGVSACCSPLTNGSTIDGDTKLQGLLRAGDPSCRGRPRVPSPGADPLRHPRSRYRRAPPRRVCQRPAERDIPSRGPPPSAAPWSVGGIRSWCGIGLERATGRLAINNLVKGLERAASGFRRFARLPDPATALRRPTRPESSSPPSLPAEIRRADSWILRSVSGGRCGPRPAARLVV
jgi:hypothetical protein